ncbi:MAG: hypothetical protein WAU59_06975 [Rhodoplanes sp.]
MAWWTRSCWRGAAENRILKAQLKGRLQLSNAERAALGEIGHRQKALAEVASVARPDTILALAAERMFLPALP